MGFKIKAADGTTLEVPDKEYYFNTKARVRRMMLNSLSSDARRVYACLELATMGWQQELAVTMDSGKIRNLTPSDVCQQTKLPKQKVREAFEELEDQGLAKREADDGGALRRGHIRLYSWAEPHPTRPKIKEVAPRGYFPSWFPDSWEPLKPLISRFRYSLVADEVAARDYIEEGAEAARDYKRAEEVATRILEKVCAERKRARPSLCIERTERTGIERTQSPTDQPIRVSVAAMVGRPVEDRSQETSPEPEPPKAPPPPEANPLSKMGPLATEIRKWLVKTYALPTAPSTEVLAELARSCRDEAGFDQFKTECAKTQNADPKSYRYFLPIARRCAEHRPEYEEALRLKKEPKPATTGFDEERLRRIVANVEESRKWR